MNPPIQTWKCATLGCRNELNDLNYRGGVKARYCPKCKPEHLRELNRRNNAKQRLNPKAILWRKRSYLKTKTIPRLIEQLLVASKELESLNKQLEPKP